LSLSEKQLMETLRRSMPFPSRRQKVGMML
jgi:hypothetical protein